MKLTTCLFFALLTLALPAVATERILYTGYDANRTTQIYAVAPEGGAQAR